MSNHIHICSWSSEAAELKPSLRNSNGVLYALKHHPKISTFDMSEKPWLQSIIKQLVADGMIEKVDCEYPWHEWKLTDKGIKATIT